MAEHQIPNDYVWLATSTLPPGGPRKRWRDMICEDHKILRISETDWYRQTSQSDCWLNIYLKGLSNQCREHQLRQSQHQNQVICEQCGRCFRRSGDKARHKRIDERQKPVHEQCGAAQCSSCSHWFRSRGGLCVHRHGTPQRSGTN